MQVAPDVSVIIAAFTMQRWDNLLAAIDSVRCQTLAPRELIVCIDHNRLLLERIRQHVVGLADIQVVENRWPRGVSGARNTGVGESSGAVCAFLDDDAVAEPDWLATLVRAYAEPDTLGVGGGIEPLWQQGRPPWFPEEFDWVVGCSYRGLPTSVASTRNLIGANMSFRRHVLEELGGFRVDTGRVGEFPPVGCEDTEVCIRARHRWPRGRFMYDPQARVRHSVPRSRGSWSYFLSRCYSEGASKAHLARLFGLADSLSLERTYVIHTLPVGVGRGVLDSLRQRQIGGVSRGAAIAAGLVSAAMGFAVGATRNSPPPTIAMPVEVVS